MENGSESDLEEIKKIIRATVISSPDRSMTIRDLLEQYKCVENEELPFEEFGFRSPYDFLLTIPDTVKLLDQSNRNSFLVPVTTAQTEHIDRLVRCQRPPKKSRRRIRLARTTSLGIKKPVSNISISSNRNISCYREERRFAPKVPEKVISRLAKLLTTNKLTWTDNPLREYQKTYHEELQPKHFGFQSECEFMKYLDCRYKGDSSFRKVVDLPLVELSYAPNKEIVNSQPPPNNEALPGMVTFDPFPPEVCNGDFNLGSDPSFDELKAGDRVDVNLGEVFSLGKFNIILKSKIKLLDSVMVDLNKFYKFHDEKYKMPISLITSNLLCACVYSKNSQWHRARVINHFHSLKSAKVCFIDYGTTEIVTTDKLRYLHKDFAKYPPFCIKARLSGIQPKSGDCYSDFANREFLRLFGSSFLVAEIVRKLLRGYEIFLESINGEHKVSVHRDLISRNLVQQKGAQTNSHTISMMSKLDFSKLRLPLPIQPPPGGRPLPPQVCPPNRAFIGPPYPPWPYSNPWTLQMKPHAFFPAHNYLPQPPYLPMPWHRWAAGPDYNLFRPPPGSCSPFRPPMWCNYDIPSPPSVTHAEYSDSASLDSTYTEKKSFISNESISATSDYESCDSKSNNTCTEHALESELNEFLRIIEDDGEDAALKERRAVENELKKLLDLDDDDDNEEENFAYLSNLKMTPPTRITNLDVDARDFIPKNLPEIENLTTDTKVSQTTISTPNKKIGNLNELRNFVMQQQMMKNASL